MAKNILISGCSTGIGRACALHFSKTGYHVFACVRKEADAESIKAEDKTGNLEPVLLDVTNELQLGELKAKLSQRLSEEGLVGLVNNAGIGEGGPLETVDPQIVRNVFNVNVMGPLLLTQAFLPLIRIGKGRIITIGSIAGKISSPGGGVYSISKFGIEAFNDALRQELAPQGIHVSLIEPGPIETPMLMNADEKTAEAKNGLSPEELGRYGEMIESNSRMFVELQSRALPAQAVADVVEHALEASKPKTRYLVTTDAKIGSFLKWLLSDRALDWVSVKMMR